MVDFDVPSLPVQRLVVEYDELIRSGTFGNDFAVC